MHRHVVLSLPRRLRPFFLYDRSLLCPMARCAWETLKEFLQTAAGRDEGVPGAVIGIHTCGDLLDWHPHVHVLISWGVFSREGAFRHVKAVPSKDTLEKLFRHKVLGLLRDRSLISEDAVANLLAWHHPGFGGYVSDRVGVGSPGGSTGLPEKLLGYLVRAPVALDRMTVAEPGPVIYRADSVHPRHRANFRAFRDPLELITALVPHIAGVHGSSGFRQPGLSGGRLGEPFRPDDRPLQPRLMVRREAPAPSGLLQQSLEGRARQERPQGTGRPRRPFPTEPRPR